MSDAQKIQHLTNAVNYEKRRADTVEAKLTALQTEHRSFLRRIGAQLGACWSNKNSSFFLEPSIQLEGSKCELFYKKTVLNS